MREDSIPLTTMRNVYRQLMLDYLDGDESSVVGALDSLRENYSIERIVRFVSNTSKVSSDRVELAILHILNLIH